MNHQFYFLLISSFFTDIKVLEGENPLNLGIKKLTFFFSNNFLELFLESFSGELLLFVRPRPFKIDV